MKSRASSALGHMAPEPDLEVSIGARERRHRQLAARGGVTGQNMRMTVARGRLVFSTAVICTLAFPKRESRTKALRPRSATSYLPQ